jgi:hypothetical protein
MIDGWSGVQRAAVLHGDVRHVLPGEEAARVGAHELVGRLVERFV